MSIRCRLLHHVPTRHPYAHPLAHADRMRPLALTSRHARMRPNCHQTRAQYGATHAPYLTPRLGERRSQSAVRGLKSMSAASPGVHLQKRIGPGRVRSPHYSQAQLSGSVASPLPTVASPCAFAPFRADFDALRACPSTKPPPMASATCWLSAWQCVTAIPVARGGRRPLRERSVTRCPARARGARAR